MDSKVTALERAFQLARSGGISSLDDIRKRLKREGYDDRVVLDGGRLLTTQLKELIRAAGVGAQPGVGAPPDRSEPRQGP
jgi:hypothetical protein